MISSFPYITTSTPLSPLSANDIEPSKPPLSPFFDFSHLRQLLISPAASPRPLSLHPRSADPSKATQHRDVHRLYVAGRQPPPIPPLRRSAITHCSRRRAPLCPSRPQHRCPYHSKRHACSRPPAQGGPARGYSRRHHQHAQQADRDVQPRHLDPSPASPTLPPDPPGSRLLEKPSPTEDFHARRDQWLSGLDRLFGISSTKTFSPPSSVFTTSEIRVDLIPNSTLPKPPPPARSILRLDNLVSTG